VKRQQSPKSAVPVSTLSAVPDMPIAKPASVSLNHPLVYIGSSFLANVLDHAGQKAAGVHNHDLKKQNDEILRCLWALCKNHSVTDERVQKLISYIKEME
jgi:hypothetical protein